MEFAIYLLIFVLIILIGVITSKKVRNIVGNIYEFILKGAPILFSWIGIIIFILLFILFIQWVWNKLQVVFPKLMSLKEIFLYVLTFTGFALYSFIVFWIGGQCQKITEKYLTKNRNITNAISWGAILLIVFLTMYFGILYWNH